MDIKYLSYSSHSGRSVNIAMNDREFQASFSQCLRRGQSDKGYRHVMPVQGQQEPQSLVGLSYNSLRSEEGMSGPVAVCLVAFCKHSHSSCSITA